MARKALLLNLVRLGKKRNKNVGLLMRQGIRKARGCAAAY